ncbi:MAG: 2-phospho-L-lactate transferase [Anaerolineaceae bacterium]
MVSDIGSLKVVALAGGVGGAKLAVGLNHVLPPENLTIIVNTGDDFVQFGLAICPDLDTVCYSLAGMSDATHGWGVEGETWNVLKQLKQLGAPSWFALGDKDLALHLERTRLLHEGNTLTEATHQLCKNLGIFARALPMTDLPAPTKLELRDGEVLSFQEYFVRDQYKPEIKQVILPDSRSFIAPPAAIEALEQADLVVICPSNPWVSIDPILNVPPLRELVKAKPAIAVSPLINGAALKGPAAKMFAELGIEASAESVLEHYADLIDGFVYDSTEAKNLTIRPATGIIIRKTNTIMKDANEKTNLAKFVLELGLQLLGHDTQ